MSRAVFKRTHKWRGVRVDRGLWLRITVAFWTWDFFPGPISARLETVIDAMRGPLS